MAQEDFDKDVVGTSKFYMLRALIAMAHADGVVCDEERAYMAALMNRLPLSDEQRRTLEADLNEQQNIDDLLKFINDPKYRGQLPYFARLMAFKDGELDPSEEALLEKMRLSATDGLDMDAIRAEAQRAAQLEVNAVSIEIDKMRPQGGLFGAFDKMMLAMGVDLLRD